MTTRCKFVVDSVVRHNWNIHDKTSGKKIGFGETVTLSAQYDDAISKENKSFADATPTGKMEFTVSNPAVVGKFEPGQKYYIDLTPAPE